MSVDLRSNSQFARVSVLLMDDCMIKLEHARTQDRMRKTMYESIESVTLWRRIPGVRITVCAVLLALPGIALLFVGDTAVTIIGIFLILLGGGLITFYLVCGKTTIRITKGGKNYDITGIFRPSKVRKFREKLIAGIRRVQERVPAIQPASATMNSAPPETFENSANSAPTPPPAPPVAPLA